jgi:hypothetical protein
MKKGLKRVVSSRQVEDPGTIDNIEYNSASGAQKNLNVGPALEYVGELTAVTEIAKGDILYIFKATTGISYVTMGNDNTITQEVAPTINTFPVFGEEFTIYSAYNFQYIVGTADIHLYRLVDDSAVRNNP